MDINGRTLWTVLLTISLVVSTFTVIPMETSGDVLIVDAGGEGDHLKIQEAVDKAEPGDEIQVLSGLYEEDVLIDKSLTLEGEEGVVISGESYGVKVEADDCYIGNISVEQSKVGIEVVGNSNSLNSIHVSESGKGVVFFQSKSNSLMNSTIENCSTGILFYQDSSNLMKDCTVSGSEQQGIRVSGSQNSTFSGNFVSSSGYHSIYLSRSDDVSVLDNNFTDNERGAYIFESVRSRFVNNTLGDGLNLESDVREGWNTHEIYGNQVGDGSLEYYIDNSDVDLEFISGQIILVNCSGFSIRHNDLSNVESGVTLASSSNNTIYGNDLRKNYRGVDMFNSENNTFHHNNFVNNTFQVHSVDGSSKDNSWSDGLGNGNHWSDYGGDDDGSGGRTAEDGVGDTEIPHPSDDNGYGYHGLDSEPLMDEVVKSNNVIELNNDSGGWNFVSFGIEMGEVELDELLSTVDYEKVMYYSSEDDRWLSFVPGREDHFNEPITLERSMGFWVNVQEQQELNLTGVVPTRTLVELEPGWNMVGIAAMNDVSESELPSEVDAVGIYNGSREYFIEYIEPGEVILKRGSGYWIHNSGDDSVMWNVH